MEIETDTIQEQHYEPQAFIADPERGWDMVEVTKGQLEALRSGDQATWDDLAKDFDPAGIGKEKGHSEPKKKTKSAGYLKEIEPSRANQEAWDQARSIWEKTGAIKPPFEKDLLCRIARTSGVLQECIQTYITVIEGFGYTFKPMLDPDADDAYEQVKLTMWNRRVESGGLPELTEPTDEEVKQELKDIRRDIKFQKLRAERFFRNAGRINGEPVGFTSLRQRIRDDIERTGEWYWEVLEDENGNPRRLNFLPSVGMRKMPLEEKQIKVKGKERIDDFTIVEVDEWRKFRRFIQVDPDLKTEAYFKELGDPRVLSSKSGKFYKTELELKMEEPGVAPATCVITHGIPDSETPYGIPRWIANSPAIGGSRKAEEVNFSYFDNKTIPPFIILVSGGRLSSQAQDRIKTYLRSLKGSENFHKLLVLEAAPFAANMPGQPPQRVQIEVVPLIKFLKEDGLFLKYLEFNDTRIGANFACPPLLRGRSEEYTRAVARETLRFFEKMVAQPERAKFDEIINTKILPELGLTLVRFESLGADTSDPEVVAKVLDVLLNHGALLPVDGRQEAEKLLRRELPKVDEDFMKKPLKLSVVEVSTRGSLPRDALEDELNDEEVVQPEQTEVQQNIQIAGAYMKKLSKSLKEDVLFDLKGFGRESTWIGIGEEEN